MSQKRTSIDSFAIAIIEGERGMTSYEESERPDWPYSDRVSASIWTMRCLSNPNCKGSDTALKAIIKRRKQLKEGKI